MYHWVETRISPCFVFLVFCLSLSFLTILPTVNAQSFLGESVGVSLVASPSNPPPNTTVQISLDDYSVDSVGATVIWYVDGVEQKASQNERTLKIESGPLGKVTSVKVNLIRKNASPLSNTLNIIPSVVDIVMEANTYTPSFYHGRALPSEESTIRMIAIVHDGTKTADTAYTYKWSENGTVLFGGPLKGKNVIELPLSRYGTRGFAVQVFNSDGESVGGDFFELRAVKPELHFYEESPLRGLSERVLAVPFPLIGDEVTVYGEPYFINAQVGTGEMDFTWKINGGETSSDTNYPNALTLRRVGGEGSAQIDLQVLTTKKIPQLIEKAFNIVF